MSILKLFVKNIPYNYSLDVLKNDLKNIEGILNIDLPIVEKKTISGSIQLTRGYCIITFNNKINMDICMKQIINCDDRILKFEKYNEKIKVEKPFIISIIGIKTDIQLKNMFSKYETKKCFLFAQINRAIVEFCNKKDYDYFLSIKQFNNIFFEKFC
jgi:hypothetical protein